jgi:hypothetical protein
MLQRQKSAGVPRTALARERIPPLGVVRCFDWATVHALINGGSAIARRLLRAGKALRKWLDMISNLIIRNLIE